MSNEPAKFFLNARMPLINDALMNFFRVDRRKLNSKKADEMRVAVIKKIMNCSPKRRSPVETLVIWELLDEFVLTPAYKLFS